MTQIGATQGHVQGFRSVHRSEPHSPTSAPLGSPNITHIDCYTDPDTNKDFILWEDIQQVFGGVIFVRNKTKMLPFVRGKDYRVLEPRRIEATPDVVLDVVMGDISMAATDIASADTIATLQLTVRHLLLNMPFQTSIESPTHNAPCGNQPEFTQDKNHIDHPESASSPRRPQASECHSEDSTNGNTIDTGRLEATNNTTMRLNLPQDYASAANMSLMQTMINANYGDAYAQIALGDRYYDGREVHQDHDAAFDWYLKAAKQGHPRAQYNIGLLYEEVVDEGVVDGGDVEEEEGDEEGDDVDGGYEEGDNEEGEGVDEDYEEGNYEEGDDVEGEYEEGGYEEENYEEGSNEEGHEVFLQDNTKAFEWFLKSAVQGYVDAQVKVSQAYTDGAGVPKDNIKAMEWSVKAAENGDAEMQHYMGTVYEKGEGVPQSDSKSFEWYLKSANQEFPEAQERVAAAFEAGRGVPKDRAKALEWYTKAANQELPAAQFALGRMHRLGRCGLSKNQSKAVDWFIKAAVQGHIEAQIMLREIYYHSCRISNPAWDCETQAQSKIKEWFMNAAEQGVAHAQCCMADMYLDGHGVDEDISMAFQWYLKAAEQGDEAAQNSVASMYETGRGVTQNRERSIEWYIELAKSGDGWAVHCLKVIMGNKQ